MLEIAIGLANALLANALQQVAVGGDAGEPSLIVHHGHRHLVLRQHGVEGLLDPRRLRETDRLACGEQAHGIAEEGVLQLPELGSEGFRILVVILGRRSSRVWPGPFSHGS